MTHDDCDFHDIDSRAGDEVFELRDEVEKLQAKVERLTGALRAIVFNCACRGTGRTCFDCETARHALLPKETP